MKTTLALTPTRNDPPQVAGALPYFGHLVAFGRDPLGFIDKTVPLGDVVEIKIPGHRAFQLYRAEDVEQVLTHTNDKDFAKFDFIAGHETTALALTWAFYLLSQHPASDAAIAAEIRQALGERQPTLADLPNLKAADRVVRESMRLYPPLWSIASRLVLQDCELSGYPIPQGSVIFLSPWAMHHNPRYFANPLDFQPERWRDEFIKTLPRYAYFPFGAGQRVCIGLPFAMLEATLALAMIVRRFKLELVAGQQVELLPSFTLRPKEKMLMRVVER